MNKRILIIEDNAYIIEVLIKLLHLFGYEAVGIQSGSEALKRVDLTSYDALFLDIHLSDMNGRELFRELVERAGCCPSRIIFMTGDLGNPETLSFILESGCPWLEKPFTIAEMKALLSTS